MIQEENQKYTVNILFYNISTIPTYKHFKGSCKLPSHFQNDKP